MTLVYGWKDGWINETAVTSDAIAKFKMKATLKVPAESACSSMMPESPRD